MTPIRLDYEPTPLRLAASLGSEVARESMSREQRETLDDAFAVLMTCSDTLGGDKRFDYGPPCYWPYTLEAAMRIAVASFRAFVVDWDNAFRHERESIPENVPDDYPRVILGTVGRWIVDPASYEHTNTSELYQYIKDDVCLDGYLKIDFPNTPSVVATFCFGSLYLIDVAKCYSDIGPTNLGYYPSGIYSARMPDAIGQWLVDDFDEVRIRQAVREEVVPWCLGHRDPLAIATSEIDESQRLRFAQ